MGRLFDKIKQDLGQAMKQKDEAGVRTLRFLLSSINNFVIAKYPPVQGGLPVGGVPDEDVVVIIQKLVKTHQESIEAFRNGDRVDLVAKEEAELQILKTYLPIQLDETTIRKMAEETKAKGLTDFGSLMKELMIRVKGRADGATVAKIVKEVLGV